MKFVRLAFPILSATVLVVITGTGCLPGPYEAGTPDSLFSEFVLVRDLMDSYYACFIARENLDWTQVYQQYRDAAQNLSSRDDMIELALEMLGELEDMGVALFDSAGNRYESCDPGYFQNWDREVFGSYLTGWEQADTLLPYKSFTLPEPLDSIGYMYIGTLGEDYTIDFFFGSTGPISQCSRLILDLRFCNRIGMEVNAFYSMGRFTETMQLGYYRQFRSGPDRHDMGEPDPVYAQKNGAWQFTEPIVVLTGRYTQGAAELLVLLLRTQEHVTIIGDSTAGYANPSVARNLTGSWLIEIPHMLTYDPEMNMMFDNPIPPDLPVQVSEDDLAAGIDPVLDAALEMCISGTTR